ncbi:MAG: hypothetical protein QW562_06900 [Thermosphaera sp.]
MGERRIVRVGSKKERYLIYLPIGRIYIWRSCWTIGIKQRSSSNTLMRSSPNSACQRVPDHDRSQEIQNIEKLVAKPGTRYIPTFQMVLGTDVMVQIVSNITRYLEERNAKISTLISVEDIRRDHGGFKLIAIRGEFYVKKLLIASGRGGGKMV